MSSVYFFLICANSIVVACCVVVSLVKLNCFFVFPSVTLNVNNGYRVAVVWFPLPSAVVVVVALVTVLVSLE